MLEAVGLLLLIQGVGGLINNLAGGSESWFLLNYLDLPPWARLTGHVLAIGIGGSILLWRKVFRSPRVM
ncbi:hypothetical protein DFR70_11958 [Nocardia tenerifensis]|uniref:Uncharacterized protein n=1 Tax=Nocardia tenerifensis TaxID=228006 RepID=A0A318JQM7_9NOCA|nr:hypothetical protein [Nocardia tenerifensis]PXX56506.1 hypothetical protein DFR70_11958 [Nocardia tenerifensis]